MRHPYDLIVVGFGAAGAAAAIEAADAGARVLILDRAHGGGASTLSGGWCTPVAGPRSSGLRESMTPQRTCSPTSLKR